MKFLIRRVSRSIVSAFLLTLLLILGITGIASASSSAPAVMKPCLTAVPATQTVGANQLVKVQVTAHCIPHAIRSFVDIAWGDQRTSKHFLCWDACPRPPIMITAKHRYATVGAFHPDICVVPTFPGSVPDCIRVEILVIQLA